MGNTRFFRNDLNDNGLWISGTGYLPVPEFFQIYFLLAISLPWLQQQYDRAVGVPAVC